MPSTISENRPSRFSILIVTTDESIRPEAEACLSAEYDLYILNLG